MYFGTSLDESRAKMDDHERLCSQIMLEREAHKAAKELASRGGAARVQVPRLRNRVSNLMKQLGTAHLW